MGQRLGQGQRLLTPPHGLRGIAQAPQRIGRNSEAPHLRGYAMVERMSPLRRQVDEGNPLLAVRQGGGVFTQEEQGDAERFVGSEEVRWYGRAPRQPVELFSQLPRRGQCPPSAIEIPQAPQRRE